MSDNPIRMSDVTKRKFLLESSKSSASYVTKDYCKSVKKRLTMESVSHFIDKVSKSGKDCEKYVCDVLDMVDKVDVSDIQKQKLELKVADQILPSVSSDKIRDISNSNMNTPKIKNKINRIQIMDRILKNDETLSKRFDFDKIIKNSNCKDVENTIQEMCSLLDTYQLSLEAKYNIALENFSYSFYKNLVNIDKQKILDYVTEYFLESRSVIKDRDVDGIMKVLKNNAIIRGTAPELYGVIESAYMNKRYYNTINELANQCENEKVSKFIREANNIKNENQAMIYINKAIKAVAVNEMNSTDRKNLMSSVMVIPLIGNVSKSFVNSQIKLQESKYNYQSKINDKNYLVLLNEALLNEDELCYNANIVNEQVSLENDIFDANYKEKDIIDTLLESEDYADSNDIKKVLDQFKADQNKSIGRFKSCMLKIYRKSPENIIDETPHILSLIRTVFIIGSISIPTVGPAIGIILYFVDHMISSHINKAQATKLINALDYEKKLTKEKLEKGKGNKADLEKYVKCLDTCIKKCENYRYTLTDEEIEGREDDFYDDFDLDLDFDFNDDSDDDFEVMEAAKIGIRIDMISSIMEFCDDIVKKYHSKILNEIPYLFIKEQSGLDEYLDILKEYGINPEIIYQSVLQENTLTPQEKTYASVLVSKSVSVNESTNNISNDEELIREYYAMTALKEMVINEEVNLNNVKLIMQNFRKKAKDLSTKEKALWQSLDASMSGIMKAIEKSFTSNRREAIIKGSIIPSFSKCIKTAITIGGIGAFLGPVVAIIAAVGSYAVSKRLNYKERQLIYDEIDTELKVVEKELQMAENDGDMKRYRFLLQYQKKLGREKQRIKYNLKAYSRDIPDLRGDD